MFEDNNTCFVIALCSTSGPLRPYEWTDVECLLPFIWFYYVVLSAVYNAVGLAAYELFDNVDFDQWFKNQLLGELQVNHHRYCLKVSHRPHYK